MVPDQIMRQLMAEDDPPVHNSISTVGSRTLQQGLFLQLLEIEVIAEDTACAVEGNGLAPGIVEDAQTVGSHGED